MRRGQGTGEAGVKVTSLKSYHRRISKQEALKIIERICYDKGVPPPTLKIKKRNGYRWGTYFHDEKLVVLYRPISAGVVIHETTHHIINCCYSLETRSHGKEFKTELQTLYNQWL